MRPENEDRTERNATTKKKPGKHATLATPAVRHLIKSMDLRIEQIDGTGRDGRVLKEDVLRHSNRQKPEEPSSSSSSSMPWDVSRTATTAKETSIPPSMDEHRPSSETVQLTPVQHQMFKTMTNSLTIPHFLYTDTVDFTALSAFRSRLNSSLLHQRKSTTTPPQGQEEAPHQTTKFSPLPFIVKAVSLALHRYPLLNAHLNLCETSESQSQSQSQPPSPSPPINNGSSTSKKPTITYNANHNIGIAMDSPTGLVVPVIRAANTLSISTIASEIARLSHLAPHRKPVSRRLCKSNFHSKQHRLNRRITSRADRRAAASSYFRNRTCARRTRLPPSSKSTFEER